MNDTGRVGGSERIGNLSGVLHCVIQRQAVAVTCQLQSSSGNVLRRDEANVVLFKDVVDRNDVGMIQPRGCLRFEQEPSLAVGISNLLRRQSFQSDDAVKPGVAGVVDLAHSSRSQKGKYFVWADVNPCGEGHKRALILAP